MSIDPAEAIIVFITVGDAPEAVRLAEMLVDKRLAACVQILPQVESVFRWQGRVEVQPERLLLVKTTRARFADLEREVRAVHSYETPEIVAVPIIAGSIPYLQWLTDNVEET